MKLFKKVDFRKGSGTLIFGYMIMLICLFVALVLIEQYSRYDNALTTQMASDSIADGTAVYASTLSGYEDDELYNESVTRANEIANLIQNEETNDNLTNEGITYLNNLDIDRTDFDDDKVSITFTANYVEYARLESFDGADIDDGTPGQNYYSITRNTSTLFTRGYNSGGNQDWVNHIYDIYYNYMATGTDYPYSQSESSTLTYNGQDYYWRHDCSGTVSVFLMTYGELSSAHSTVDMNTNIYNTFQVLKVGVDITSVSELVPGDILLDPATHTQIITTVSEYNESTQSVSIGGMNFGSGTVSTIPYYNITIRNGGNSFNTFGQTFTYIIRAPEK